MGFLDNVKEALRGAVSSHGSKDAAATKDEVVEPGAEVETEPEAVPPAPRFETYTVQTGDSLGEIGTRFGVSPEEIARLNDIENPHLIFPGQVFRIPQS
jgi:LysM repeat protein